MTSVVASRGKAVRPHVVRSIAGQEAAKPEPPVEAGVQTAPGNWDAIHLAMRRVIEGGTANAVRVPGVIVGGKTGTAQNPHGNDHALFVCFAPIEAPTVAMAIVAENSGHGGSVSAPIANQVLNRMFARDSSAVVPVAAAAADSTAD
jgi:penicillin-binding protein 2